jgi:hypothetical protein
MKEKKSVIYHQWLTATLTRLPMLIYASISFNDDDVWYEYEVDFVNVIEHLYDVRSGQALIEYDFEGNLTQWIPIEDVEIDGYDVLEYLIDNALLKTYSAITNTENF